MHYTASYPQDRSNPGYGLVQSWEAVHLLEANMSKSNRLAQPRYILAALLSLVLCTLAHAGLTDAKPDASYSPEEVVQIVIDSLQQNDTSDAGIATVYRFASPGNKTSTGPLKRFTQMIKRGFPDMLNHAGARYDPMEITGNTAVQAVWLRGTDGSEVGYAFQLGKQNGGILDGAWMTDAVIPLGKGKQDGIGI